MKLRGLVLSGLLAALVAPVASAQGGGTVEFGLFARKNWFGESYGLKDKVGPGARLGFFLIRGIEIEASGSYTPTSYQFAIPRVGVMNLAGQLVGHVPMGDHVAFLLGGGYVYNKYTNRGDAVTPLDADGDDKGPRALAGFRFGLGDVVSVRVDGTADYMSNPNEQLSNADKDWHWGFQAGLSWLFGANRSMSRVPDTARDGIRDDERHADDDRHLRDRLRLALARVKATQLLAAEVSVVTGSDLVQVAANGAGIGGAADRQHLI